MLKPHQPHDVFERVKDREHKADEHLAGQSGATTWWSRLHLKLGNLMDEMYSITGNEHVSAGVGMLIGLGRGMIYGLFVAGLAMVFPVIITGPIGLVLGQSTAMAIGASAFNVAATAIVGTSAFFGIKDSISFFREARADSAAALGAKKGDAIAKKGGALGKGASPETTKALDQMRKEGTEPKQPDPEHPEGPENRRFADAIRQQRQQAASTEFIR